MSGQIFRLPSQAEWLYSKDRFGLTGMENNDIKEWMKDCDQNYPWVRRKGGVNGTYGAKILPKDGSAWEYPQCGSFVQEYSLEHHEAKDGFRLAQDIN